jgi:two-component system cell cycle response regulator
MNEQLLNRIRQCPTLPSLPTIALEVLDLAQREEVDIAEIARIISKDPALSSKILRTVNSSFYGRAQSVGQVSQALVILGLQSVKTLVLGFSLVSNLHESKSKGFKHIDYWKRSIYAATAAKMLAARAQMVQAEECFLAALLQDIGMLVLDQVLKDEYGAIYERAGGAHSQLVNTEREALGMTHAEVTGFLADQWKLPPVLSVPMRHHHDPAAVTDAAVRKLADVGYVAGLCADVFVEENPAASITETRKYCAEHFKLSEADCDAMLAEIGNRTKEIAPLFEIKLGKASDFDEILKKANEALVELTLRTQQQAANLQKQNIRLQEQATVDGLTGLANRARFDQFLAEQFAAAQRAKRPLSLLMLDVDKFKSVNDKHGHPVGDQVLKVIGKLLRTAARATDLAARYGGEEMILILPGTAKSTAAAIAESIRRTVAAKPVQCDQIALPITVSIGVATLDEHSPLKQPAHLLKAADLAVYAAKHGGRNCVKVFTLPTTNAATPAAAPAAAPVAAPTAPAA